MPISSGANGWPARYFRSNASPQSKPKGVVFVQSYIPDFEPPNKTKPPTEKGEGVYHHSPRDRSPQRDAPAPRREQPERPQSPPSPSPGCCRAARHYGTPGHHRFGIGREAAPRYPAQYGSSRLGAGHHAYGPQYGGYGGVGTPAGACGSPCCAVWGLLLGVLLAAALGGVIAALVLSQQAQSATAAVPDPLGPIRYYQLNGLYVACVNRTTSAVTTTPLVTTPAAPVVTTAPPVAITTPGPAPATVTRLCLEVPVTTAAMLATTDGGPAATSPAADPATTAAALSIDPRCFDFVTSAELLTTALDGATVALTYSVTAATATGSTATDVTMTSLSSTTNAPSAESSTQTTVAMTTMRTESGTTIVCPTTYMTTTVSLPDTTTAPPSTSMEPPTTTTVCITATMTTETTPMETTTIPPTTPPPTTPPPTTMGVTMETLPYCDELTTSYSLVTMAPLPNAAACKPLPCYYSRIVFALSVIPYLSYYMYRHHY